MLSEEVEVSKRAVAKELFTSEKETVTDHTVVDEAGRKERVDVEGDINEGCTKNR